MSGRRRGHGGPLLTGSVTAVGTATLLAYLLQGTLAAAVHDLGEGWNGLGLTETIVLALIVPVSGLAGAGVAFLHWEVGRFFVLRRYLRAQHATLGAYLTRAAPLLSYGFSERGLPFAADGQALNEGSEPLAHALPRSRATLILGDHGIGKTTILRESMFELTRRRLRIRIALGHAPLPIFISLPEYALAASAGMGLVEFAAQQLSRGGARDLAQHLPRSIGRWHVLLLCDGLDEVPQTAVERVMAELELLLGDTSPLVRIAVTCDLAHYTTVLPRLVGLRSFNRVVAKGLSSREVSIVLKRAARDRAAGTRRSAQIEAQLAGSGLGTQITHPATLIYALAVLAAQESLPLGRSRLLTRYVSLLLERTQPEDAAGAPTLQILGHIAALLRQDRRTLIPVPADRTLGETLFTLLSDEADHVSAAPDSPAAPHVRRADVDQAAAAASASGVLEALPDGQAVRFVSRSVEATLAALWLAQLDGHSDDAAVDVFQPEWWEPFVVRSAHEYETAGTISQVLALVDFAEYELAVPLDNHTAEAGGEACGALALALAAALETLIPPLAAPLADSAAAFAAGEALRSVFDALASTLRSAEERALFAETFVRIERETQMDITGHLATLARLPSVERLVRAQAATVLATLASPTAAATVTDLLAERDPVMRQALDQALPYASPEVAAGLQDAVTGGSEYVRHRAAEVLALGGPTAVKSASEGLTSADPRLRTASARTLGILRHAAATDALVALLRDPVPSVRVAAVRALGRIGDASVAGELSAQLPSADAELRAAIAGALADIHDPDTFSTLLTLLGDADAQVRLAAASALSTLGDDRAARALLDRRGDESPLVQAAVATALRRLGNA